MKLLRLEAEGLPLFKNKVELDFIAQQRVSEDDRESLYPIFSNVYLNPTNVFVGINASGKTTILRLIVFAINLMSAVPLNHAEGIEVLRDADKSVLQMYFFDDADEVCRLETVIRSEDDEFGRKRYFISEEKMWSKKITTKLNKAHLFELDGFPALVRGNQEYLPDDVSIMVTNKKRKGASFHMLNLMGITNINALLRTDNVPAEVLRYLDPTIERFQMKTAGNKKQAHLKFYGKDEIVTNSFGEVGSYLSSGTIKGIAVFNFAELVLQKGGYLILDEIEVHFNKQIVASLIRMFMDRDVNKYGAVLMYSTHYPELLDLYDRNDSIYIMRNEEGITEQNLREILTRNDIKKSDAFQSDFLKGTAPEYEAYARLRKYMIASVDANKEGEEYE